MNMTSTGVPVTRRPAGKGFHTKSAKRRADQRQRKAAAPPADPPRERRER